MRAAFPLMVLVLTLHHLPVLHALIRGHLLRAALLRQAAADHAERQAEGGADNQLLHPRSPVAVNR